jgi:hypothetical protein
MRRSIPALLASIAAVVAETGGCSSPGIACYGPSPKTIEVTGDEACAFAQAGDVKWATQDGPAGPCVAPLFDPASSRVCANACGSGYDTCAVPDDYLRAFAAPLAPTDATVCANPSDSIPPAASGCPVVSGTVSITCASTPCLGRRTSGVDEPRAFDGRSLGEYFATCAYFEAMSVHAFERLATELAAHGAPARLVQAARRARRDEIRHAQTTGEIARRFGVEPSRPARRDLPVRSLFDMALENAVEGCVRETYGAAFALVRAARAQDPQVRAAMQSIGHDECRHAQLGWGIAAWASTRLDRGQREAVRRAMQLAVRELMAEGGDRLAPECRALGGLPSEAEHRRMVGLLDAALWARSRRSRPIHDAHTPCLSRSAIAAASDVKRTVCPPLVARMRTCTAPSESA